LSAQRPNVYQRDNQLNKGEEDSDHSKDDFNDQHVGGQEREVQVQDHTKQREES